MEEALTGLASLEGEELKSKVVELTQNIIADQPKAVADLPLVLCGPVVGKVSACNKSSTAFSHAEHAICRSQTRPLWCSWSWMRLVRWSA